MKKLISLGLITFATFFMAGCDFLEDKELTDLPGIELVGESVMEVELNSEYVDPGVGLLGDFDLEVVIDSNVDTSTLGEYTVTYTITYLTIEYTVSRTVRVVEELSEETPSLDFIGEDTIYIEQYSEFVDPGVDILGDFEIDVVVVSDVDTNVIGVYTVTYTITYLEIEYTLTRTVEVIPLEVIIDFDIYVTFDNVTQSSFSLEVIVEDNESVLNNRYVELYKGEELVGSWEYTTGVNSIDFTYLDEDTTYSVVITGEYTDDGSIVYLSGYTTYVTTEPASELSVSIDGYHVRTYSVDLDITVVDDDVVITSNRVYIYSDGVYVNYEYLYAGFNSISIDYLDPDTNYEIYVEYNYIPLGETEEILVTMESINITTDSIPILGVSSHNADIDIDIIDFTFSLNNIGFNNVDLYATIYEGDTYVDYYYIGYDNYYYFYELDGGTEYTVYLYADYSYGGVDYDDVLIGTYTVTTLDEIVYNPPVVENVVITRTATSVTVEFDLTDTYNTMDRGRLILFKGATSSGRFDLVLGHNSFTFDSNIEENTLYTVKIDIDYMDNGVYATVYEEDVYTLPVITVNSFEENEMFYVGDHIIMKLDIENNKEVNIEFVVINGVRYSTFIFPTTTNVLYIDMGVDTSVHSYIANIESIGILLGGEEVLIDVDVDSNVSVYLLGTMVPSDATVTIIDIIPEDYFVYIDNDNPSAISSINMSVYLDNEYNLPVSSITIGGITYDGGDLTVISSTELLVSVDFSYDGNNSNNNIYFSEIIFERNGSIVSSNQSDPVDIHIFEIYNRDWDTSTAEVIHISTPEDLLAVFGNPAKPQVIYVLDNNIDMTGYNFIPIGTYDDPFTGAFNGNGYTISNVTISGTYGTGNGNEYIGIFGYSKAFIFDLNIDNVTINVTTTYDNALYVGILAGKQEADVYNVNIYNSTIIIDGLISGVVGGLAGQQHGDIIWSSADTNITITQPVDGSTNSRLYVGGLVGNKPYEDVRSSFATGDITVTSPTLRTVFTGGLLGHMYNPLGSSSPSYVINSYATGNISVDTDYYGRTGGLIGDIYDGRFDIIIMNSFATGNVSTFAGTTGGLIGETNVEVNSSFAIGTVHGTNGTISRLFGAGNDYALVKVYAYDNQIVTRDDGPINGSDTFYIYIGVATSVQFNDANYYIDHLGWSSHFFDFSNLDIENGDMPTLK